jgi:hypothetical protein
VWGILRSCVVFYRCAEADNINLSKTRIDFANEVCLGEVRVKGGRIGCVREGGKKASDRKVLAVE